MLLLFHKTITGGRRCAVNLRLLAGTFVVFAGEGGVGCAAEILIVGVVRRTAIRIVFRQCAGNNLTNSIDSFDREEHLR